MLNIIYPILEIIRDNYFKFTTLKIKKNGV